MAEIGKGIVEMRVLIVEDDPIVSEIITTHLVNEGFYVSHAGSVDSGTAAYFCGHFDFVIADINLPDGLGFDLVRAMRKHRDCGVIYVTSRADPRDRIRGLQSGGDDYIIKPAHLGELSARITAVCRRYQKVAASSKSAIDLSGATVDFLRRELADKDGNVVHLTRGEFDIFSALFQASPVSLDRDYLLEVLDCPESTAGLRTIDVIISRIRAKIRTFHLPIKILTTRGSGYRIEIDALC